MSRIAKGILPAIQLALARIAKGDGLHYTAGDMASILVTRDQFNITPEGITHKPTDASFVPHCGDPRYGSTRLGRLECEAPSRDNYDPEVVNNIMMQLWAEYLAANSDLFNKKAGGDGDMESDISDDRHSKPDR
jgi:hypothetical protein